MSQVPGNEPDIIDLFEAQKHGDRMSTGSSGAVGYVLTKEDGYRLVNDGESGSVIKHAALRVGKEEAFLLKPPAKAIPIELHATDAQVRMAYSLVSEQNRILFRLPPPPVRRPVPPIIKPTVRDVFAVSTEYGSRGRHLGYFIDKNEAYRMAEGMAPDGQGPGHIAADIALQVSQTFYLVQQRESVRIITDIGQALLEKVLAAIPEDQRKLIPR